MPSTDADTWFVPHDLAAPVPGAAAGPLAGLRVGVKDSYDVAGARTGAGSPEWLDEQHPAIQHAWAVQRLLDAGATAVGKTVCDEFFYSLSGITSHYGTPVNVRAPGRIPGGSSCGSAAATAGGACDIGLGTDTGGSIRVPSAFCGLYGLRPTHGRVPMDGCRPMAPSFDVAGWMADDAATLAAVGPVLLPAAGAVRGRRRARGGGRGRVRRGRPGGGGGGRAGAPRAAGARPRPDRAGGGPGRAGAGRSGWCRRTRSGRPTASSSPACSRRWAPACASGWPGPRRSPRTTPPSRARWAPRPRGRSAPSPGPAR